MQQPPTPAPMIAPGPGTLQGTPAPAVSRTTAQEMYQAMRAQRRELGRQLESLEQKRNELQGQLQQSNEGPANPVDRKGIEQRLTEVDTRIADVDKQISAADQAVARTAAIPGAAVEQPEPRREGPPEEVYFLSGMFMVIALLPLSIALARRIWRRSAAAITSMPQEFGDRMSRLEQAVDAIAVEMERVGEGQRFVTNILAESPRALGAGAAEPIEVRQRERAHVER